MKSARLMLRTFWISRLIKRKRKKK